MKNEALCFINISAVENRIAELGLKQWWIAEQIGVSERTITRWLNGQVKQAHLSNISLLATVLECQATQLIAKSEEEVFASRDIQNKTAKLIEDENLLKIFSKQHNWELFESIIRSTLNTRLPLHRLGLLYLLISHAKLAVNQLDAAFRYAELGLEIGAKLSDHMIVAKAHTYFFVVHARRMNKSKALASYQAFLQVAPRISKIEAAELAIRHAQAFDNLLMHDQGLAVIGTSITFLATAHDALLYVKALALRGVLEFDLGRYSQARETFLETIHKAVISHDPRRQVYGQIFLMMCEAYLGHFDEASRLNEEISLNKNSMGLEDGSFFMLAANAQVERAKGNYQAAKNLCESALRDQSQCPADLAFVEALLFKINEKMKKY